MVTTRFLSTPPSRLHPVSRRAAWGGAAMLATLLAGPPAEAGDPPPNLVAVTISGPGKVEVDSQVLATVRVENTGGPLVGSFTAHVVLSQDLVIDGADPIVATVTDTFFGSQSVVCSIPDTLPDVKHIWGLIVEPAAGEVVLDDNWNVGPFVDVLFVDLELEDDSPIDAFVRTSQEPLEPIPVRLLNAGTPTSIVVFSSTLLSPAPWLEIDPPNSFAVGGQPGNDIFLRFDHTQLAPGEYTTTIRFQNIYHAADFEDLDVKLTVGPAFFVPGDRIFGQIANEGDVDELEFDAIEGMRLLLKLHNSTGTLNTRVTIIDVDQGTVDVSKTFKHSKTDLKKNLKMKSSGRKLMRIESKKGFGQYAIKTKRKLPKKGKAYVVKLKGLGTEEVAEAEALLLPGGTLDFGADPNSKFTGALVLGLEGPAGETYDMSGAFSDPDGGVSVEGFEIEEKLGAYIISVSGFGGGAKEKAKLRILPWQPGPSKGKIYLD